MRCNVYNLTCQRCQQVYLDAHHSLRKDNHACGTDTFTRIPVLFLSMVALLLDKLLLALEAEDLPAYKEVKARSLIPDLTSGILPFDANLDPIIHIPLGTQPEVLVPLVVDPVLVASYKDCTGKSPAERILSSASLFALSAIAAAAVRPSQPWDRQSMCASAAA